MLKNQEMMWVISIMMMLMHMYLFNKNHLMSSLITLECMTIMVMMLVFMLMMKTKMENFIILYILMILLMESVLGVSLMMSIIRTHSTEFVKSMSIMKL